MSLTMKERAQRGGRAKSARHLSLPKVEAALGALNTIQDAQRRLDVLTRWTAAGMLPGAVAGAAVRACAEWVTAEEARASFEHVAALEKDLVDAQVKIRRLEAELAHATRTADFYGKPSPV